MARFLTRELFEQLNDRYFASHREFTQTVFDIFIEHFSDFPSRYTYRDAISYAREHGWLIPEGDGLRVCVKPSRARPVSARSETHGWGRQTYTMLQPGPRKGSWILFGRKPDIPYANYSVLLSYEDVLRLHNDLAQHIEIVNDPEYREEEMGQ